MNGPVPLGSLKSHYSTAGKDAPLGRADTTMQTMNQSPHQAAKLLRHAPYFPVANVDRSVAYYEQTLGFRCEYSAGSPGEFAICSRDGLALMFRRISDPTLIVPNDKQGGTWDAFFWVSDVQGVHSELKAKGADIVYGPLVQVAYEMKEFAVRDSDGHVLGFGEALA